MNKWLSFDDVLMEVNFSDIVSRKDVDTRQYFCNYYYNLPILSSNMDTVTSPTLAKAVSKAGGGSALHRFCSIEQNVEDFKNSPAHTIGSFGLGKSELERALTLNEAGCGTLLLDIAHAATTEAVKQIKEVYGNCNVGTNIIVGNFANAQSLRDFLFHLGKQGVVSAVKIGVGGGGACLTRVQTGFGKPTLQSLIECKSVGIPMISDGGHKTYGDIAKALAAGAHMVMLGKMFCATEESPGEATWIMGEPFKKYRGSASQESYVVQGKVDSHRVYEGDSFTVPLFGSVEKLMQEISGGLRSAMSYCGARNLDSFRERVVFGEVTTSGYKENGSHGKSS